MVRIRPDAGRRNGRENLVEFYRRFVDHYFDEKVDLALSEARVIDFSTPTAWRGELNNVRNTTRHRFAPWLAFEDKGQQVQPRWEPVLIHDRRPELLAPATYTPFAHLHDIKTGLSQSAQGLLQELVSRVKATP